MATGVRELAELIVKALVDGPEDVRVVEIVGVTTALLEVHVAPGDLGKVIGKHGRNLQALRTLVEAFCGKMGTKARIELIEPDRRDVGRRD